MRLVPKPLVIGERDGFKKETDLFGYKDFGERLARFVESLEGPSVIALDGPWGSGKTVFARQWAGLLRKRGSAVIYFDAFAADSGEDPLCDIASQLFAGAADEETRRRFADAAVQVLKSLALMGAGIALGSVTGGFVGKEEVQAGAAAISENWKTTSESDEQMSTAFRHRIEGARERAHVISNFRTALESLAIAMQKEALGNAPEKEGSAPRPLVVIIDELDRCKPTYALDLLENIKHVFDAENVCFVLVTNVAQLEDVVKSEYGVKGASAYLEKFFPTSFVLPEPRRQTTTSMYIRHLFDEMLESGDVGLKEIINTIGSRVEVSLRGVERIALHVGWYLRWFYGTGMVRSYEFIFVAVAVGFVRALDADMYSRLRKGEMSFEELIEFLRMDVSAMENRVKTDTVEILRRAFPPRTAVEKGREAIVTWQRDPQSLPLVVEEVCQSLDVVDPRSGRRG